MLGLVGALAVVGLICLLQRSTPRVPVQSSAGVRSGSALIVCGAAAVAWLALGAVDSAICESGLLVPGAALAAFSAWLATAGVRMRAVRPPAAALAGAAWSVFGFAPCAVVALDPAALPFLPTGGALDLGGALPVQVAGGAALLVSVLRQSSRCGEVSSAAPRIATPTMIGATIALVVLWTISLVGLDLGTDPTVTPRIVRDTVTAAVLGGLASLAVQRFARRRCTVPATASGVLAGLVSITAGAAAMSVAGAAVTAAIAGSASCAFALRRIRVTGDPVWGTIGAHLCGGAIGVLALGVFDPVAGLLVTAQPTLAIFQLVLIAAIAAWASIVALVLLRLTTRLRSSSSA